MKKYVLIFLCGSIFSFSLVALFLGSRLGESGEVVLSSDHKTRSYSSAISMMYETESGSGIYEESKSTSWPQEGYTFNDTLSKCENGSTLSWVDGKVKMVGNVSDKCYVYFDVYVAPTSLAEACNGKNLAQCIKDNYTLDSHIYYHEPSLPNGAGDNSYRYAGSYDAVENYVCMGDDENGNCPYDKLYRIIGVFGEQVKLIKADYAKKSELGTGGDYKSTYKEYEGTNNYGTNKGSNAKEEIGAYYWNYNNGSSSNANIWANSKLNTENLNQTYLDTLGTTWAEKIAPTSWKVGGNIYQKIVSTNPSNAYQNEILSPASGQPAVNNKIGLMYVSDYYYGASPENWTKHGYTYSSNKHSSGNYGEEYDYRSAKDSNWMYNGLNEWTISRRSDTEYKAFLVYYDGRVDNSYYVYNFGFAVRPVLYLESTVTMIEGSGTFADPYRLS